MSRSKKFLIIILLFLTLITGGFAIFIGLQTRQSGGGDVSVSSGCNNYCSSGSCKCKSNAPKNANGTFNFGEDTDYPFGTCAQRLDNACNDFCGGSTFIATGGKTGSTQLTCPTTGGGGTSTGGTVTNGASCITPGNNKSLGAECNKQCGDNACDGSGPLGCNTCISGTKMGKSVCSVGANNASYFTACGMTKLVDGGACNFSEQCQSGSCTDGQCSQGKVNPQGPCATNTAEDCRVSGGSWCTQAGMCFPRSDGEQVNCSEGQNADEIRERIKKVCDDALPAVPCDQSFGKNNTCPCTANNQCSSGLCSGGKCADRRDVGDGCTVNNECKSLNCGKEIPANQTLECLPAGIQTCSNEVQDNGETGVDCGTVCGKTCSTSGGGTSGGGTVTPSGTIAVGQPCTPGANQCVSGAQCTPTAGNNICTNCPGGPGSCGDAFCAAGGGTCGLIIGLKCTGDFGDTCDSSDPGVQERTDFTTFQQAVDWVGGCGQVDVACRGGNNNKQGCGDFQIYKYSCGGGGGGGGGGDNPPANPTCNSICVPNQPGNCYVSPDVIYSCTQVGSEYRCRLPVNPTSPTCSPVVVTPFCGDAVCQAGELCERVGTTGAAANEFRQCSNNQAISSCRNLATAAPSLANGCTFCGDGVFQSGVEQCDATAPSGGGNDPANCNALCQTVAPICIGMTQNPSFTADTISSGVGNIVEYELTYQNASTTDPYPNIRLRVADPGAPTVPVGRDADNPTNALVAPAVTPTRNTTNSTWTYRFRWEAADTAGVDLPDGSYDIRALLDGTNATSVTSPAGCLEGITVDALVAEEPVFTVVKQGGLVCVADNSARIDYTISVTNSGPVAGSIDFVRDTLDPAVVALGIIPADITPTFGTYSAGAITWVGTAGDLAFTAGQTKTYTYSITIPSTQVTSFRTTGVNNTVQVQYDTGTTTDNTTEFDLTTPMTCSIIVIPVTSIFTDSTRFLLMGMIFMIGGYTVYRYRIGSTQVQGFLKALVRPLNFEEMVLHDEKFREKGKKRK